MKSQHILNASVKSNVTGLKAFALGFGLNDEAFTFKRLFAVVGDAGVVIPAEAEATPGPGPEPDV